MGITGLLRFVKDATEPIHIKKYAGRTVAVDTYCWIHRGSFACAEKLAKNEHTDQYVKYCMKFIDMMESFHVKPVLVFDGCRLPSKEHVEQERHKRRKENLEKGRRLLREGNVGAARDCFTKCISVTPAMALRVIEAARARGVDCIVAPYEADAQLAFFSKMQIAQAIITEDSDLLCFGCKNVIFKMDLTGRAQEVSMDNLGRVKNLVGFTPDLFRHMCILSGCDYLPSVKGVGLVKACKALKLSKSKSSYQVAAKLHQYIKGLSPVDTNYGAEFARADKTFLYQLVFDPMKRKILPLNTYPKNVGAKELEFAGPLIEDEKAFQIALGNIDINTKLVIGYFDIDNWVRSRKSMDNLPSIWGEKNNKKKLMDESSIKKSISLVAQFGNPSRNEVDAVAATDALSAVTNEQDAVPDTINFAPKNEPIPKSMKKIEVGDIKDLLQTYQTKKVKKKTQDVPDKTVRSRFFAPKSLSPPSKDFDTTSDSIDNVSSSNVDHNEIVNHSNSLFSDKKSSEDSILNEILDEINEQVDSVVTEKVNSPGVESSLKRSSVVLSSGEALERFSNRKRKKRLTVPLVDCPSTSNEENKAIKQTLLFNDESIPFLDKNCVSQSLFGDSANKTPPSPESASLDVDLTGGENKSHEEIPILDQILISNYEREGCDSASQRQPLRLVADENHHLPSSPQKVVISSDDEPDAGQNTPNKCQTRRLGLPSHGKFKSPVKINTSKYFTGSKASGLRKRKRHSAPNQPSIKRFFCLKS